MNEKIKEMIRMAAEDGVITEKEKALIIKKAKALGEDVDMVELAIEGELGQLKKDAVKTASKGEKCPNCGSIIPPGSAVCPSCGFALVSKKTNDTAYELQKDLNKLDQQLIDKIDSINKRIAATSSGFWGSDKSAKLDSQADDIKNHTRSMKANRICSTVVPNNRDDLLSLLAFTAPKANRLGPRDYEKGDADDFSYAYWQLFENCILMAKNSFMNDPSFLPYYQKYERMTKKKPFEWYRKLSGSGKEVIIYVIGMVVLFLVAIVIIGISQA